MKTNLYKIVLLPFLLICAGSAAQSQWEKTSWNSGPVDDLQGRGRFLYVISGANFFRSSDEGGSWQKIDEIPRPSSLLSAGKSLFVKSVNQQYYSVDSGQTWWAGGNGLPSDYHIVGGTKRVIVAVSDSDKIYVSTDLGQSFELGEGLVNWNATVYFDSLLISSKFFEIKASRDFGVTWITFDSGIKGRPPGGFRYNDLFLYRVTSRHGGAFFRLNEAKTAWLVPNPIATFEYANQIVVMDLGVAANSWYQLYFMDSSGSDAYDVSQGLPENLESLGATANYIFVGYKNDGMWRRKISELAVPPNSVNEASLANPAETIRIFDLLGRDFSVPGINSIEEAMHVLLPHGFYLIVSPQKHVGRYVE